MYSVEKNNNNSAILLKYQINLLWKNCILLTDPKRLAMNNVNSIHIQHSINAIKTKKIAIIKYITILQKKN